MPEIKTLNIGIGGAGGKVLDQVAGDCAESWALQGDDFVMRMRENTDFFALDSNQKSLSRLVHISPDHRGIIGWDFLRGQGAGNEEGAQAALADAIPILKSLYISYDVVRIFASRAKNTGRVILDPACRLAEEMGKLPIRYEIIPSLQGNEVTSPQHARAMRDHNCFLEDFDFHGLALLNDAASQFTGRTDDILPKLNAGIGPTLANEISLLSQLENTNIDPNDIATTCYFGSGYIAPFALNFRRGTSPNEIPRIFQQAIQEKRWLTHHLCEFDPRRLHGILGIIQGDIDYVHGAAIRGCILQFANQFRELGNHAPESKRGLPVFDPIYLPEILPGYGENVHVTILFSEEPRAAFTRPRIQWLSREGETEQPLQIPNLGSIRTVASPTQAPVPWKPPTPSLPEPSAQLHRIPSLTMDHLKVIWDEGPLDLLFYAVPEELRSKYKISVPPNSAKSEEAVFWIAKGEWYNQDEAFISDGKGGASNPLPFMTDPSRITPAINKQLIEVGSKILPLIKLRVNGKFATQFKAWYIAQIGTYNQKHNQQLALFWEGLTSSNLQPRTRIPLDITLRKLETHPMFTQKLEDSNRGQIIVRTVYFLESFGFDMLNDSHLFEPDDDRGMLIRAKDSGAGVKNSLLGLFRRRRPTEGLNLNEVAVQPMTEKSFTPPPAEPTPEGAGDLTIAGVPEGIAPTQPVNGVHEPPTAASA